MTNKGSELSGGLPLYINAQDQSQGNLTLMAQMN